MSKLDSRFEGTIRRVDDNTAVNNDEYIVFEARDDAFAAILPAYRDKCIELGSDKEHTDAVDRMITRMNDWRTATPGECRKPDAKDKKLLDVVVVVEPKV